jgi:hypothetical protein
MEELKDLNVKVPIVLYRRFQHYLIDHPSITQRGFLTGILQSALDEAEGQLGRVPAGPREASEPQASALSAEQTRVNHRER